MSAAHGEKPSTAAESNTNIGVWFFFAELRGDPFKKNRHFYIAMPIHHVVVLQCGQSGPKKTPEHRWYGLDEFGRSSELPTKFPYTKLDCIPDTVSNPAPDTWACVRGCVAPVTNHGLCKACWLHEKVVESDRLFKVCFALMNPVWDLPHVPTGRNAIVLSAALSAAAIAVRSATTPAVAVQVAMRMYNDHLGDGVEWRVVLRKILRVLVGEDHRRYNRYVRNAPAAAAPEVRPPGTLECAYDAAASWAAGAPQRSVRVIGPADEVVVGVGVSLFAEYKGVRMTMREFEANPAGGGRYAMVMDDGMVVNAHAHKDDLEPNAGQLDAGDAYTVAHNCKICRATGRVITTRKLYGGDKVLLDYGADYWRNIRHTVFIRNELVCYDGKPCKVVATGEALRDLFITLKDVGTHKRLLAPVEDVSFPDPEAAVVSRKRRGEKPPTNPKAKAAKVINEWHSELALAMPALELFVRSGDAVGETHLNTLANVPIKDRNSFIRMHCESIGDASALTKAAAAFRRESKARAPLSRAQLLQADNTRLADEHAAKDAEIASLKTQLATCFALLREGDE